MRSHTYLFVANDFAESVLNFRHNASYIYRTDVPLLPRVRFLYIFIQQIYLIF
jgi:hypothetical protein